MLIPGANGSWDVTITPSPDPKGSDKIDIKFTPAAAVRCENIRLVQTVKKIGLDKNGKVVAQSPDDLYEDPDDSPYGFTKGDQVTNPGGVTVFIDSKACEGDPYYNGEDVGKAAKPLRLSYTTVDTHMDHLRALWKTLWRITSESSLATHRVRLVGE